MTPPSPHRLCSTLLLKDLPPPTQTPHLRVIWRCSSFGSCFRCTVVSISVSFLLLLVLKSIIGFLVNSLFIFLSSFKVQWALRRRLHAGVRVVFPKLPAVVAVFPGVWSVWSFLGVFRIWDWVSRSWLLIRFVLMKFSFLRVHVGPRERGLS